jgi:protein TonB
VALRPVTQTRPTQGGQFNSQKSDGTTGTKTRSQAASSASGSGGGAALSKAKFVDYQSSVVQTLMRYREYPSAARRRGIEGRNMVLLVIERDGTVSLIKMVQESGNRLLDRATEKMIERVKRFPPFPDDLDLERMTLRVPLIYDLR